MVKTPDCFYWSYGAQNYADTLQFLMDLKSYVAELDVPKNQQYRQMAHSGDTKVVGDDITKPAVLDASYKHFNRHLLSISVPVFTPVQAALMIPKELDWKDKLKNLFANKANSKVEYVQNTGLNSATFSGAFTHFLEENGINVDEVKTGTSAFEGTFYVEVDIDEDDFVKGKEIIQRYIHCSDDCANEFKGKLSSALSEVKPSTSTLLNPKM